MHRIYLTIIFLFFTLKLCAQDSLRTYYAWSLDAYKKKDYAMYLKYAKRANDLRPNHPVLGYNIASAYALNGFSQESIEALKRYLQMNATMDFMQDLDFLSIKDEPDFKKLKVMVTQLNERIENSQEAYHISQKENHFESIGYHPKSEAFILGSINTRSLFSFKNNELTNLLSYTKNPELYGVMGIDYSDEYLWVCTTVLPEINEFKEEIENQSSIFGLHPGNYKIKFQYTVPDALLGDLIVVNEHLTLASDGKGNKIYELRRTGAQVYADFGDKLFNLQGLAWVEGRLIVADYILGLHAYNPVTKELSKIESNGLFSEKGIDGITYANNFLFCFQNGTTPKRAFRIKIKDFKVEQVTVMDQDLHEQGEPTQGVVVKNDLYYISNSAWDAYDEGKYTSGEELVLRKLKIEAR